MFANHHSNRRNRELLDRSGPDFQISNQSSIDEAVSKLLWKAFGEDEAPAEPPQAVWTRPPCLVIGTSFAAKIADLIKDIPWKPPSSDNFRCFRPGGSPALPVLKRLHVILGVMLPKAGSN